MGKYEELRAKYGEWMKREDVSVEVGRTSVLTSGARDHYGLKGVETKEAIVNGRHRILFATKDVARNIEAHGAAQEKKQKHKQARHLCGTCRWRSRYSTGYEANMFCAYCMHPGHKTKHWHKAHGVPNALDTAHCPFYEKGRHERLPMIGAYIDPPERSFLDT